MGSDGTVTQMNKVQSARQMEECKGCVRGKACSDFYKQWRILRATAFVQAPARMLIHPRFH